MANLSMQSQSIVDQAKADLDDKLKDLPENERRAAARQLRSAAEEWIPKDNASKAKIWMVLIIGLLVLAALCVIGGTVLEWHKRDGSALFAAVTGIVGLLVGLFAAPAGANTDN